MATIANAANSWLGILRQANNVQMCLPPALPARPFDISLGLRLKPFRKVGMLAAPIVRILASIFWESFTEPLAFTVFACERLKKHARLTSRSIH